MFEIKIFAIVKIEKIAHNFQKIKDNDDVVEIIHSNS